MRDLVGLGLIVSGVVEVILAYYLMRHERVLSGRWRMWPPTRGTKLAATFFHTALVLIVLGALILRGDGPIVWWSLPLIGALVVAVMALWIDWARVASMENGDDSHGGNGGGHPVNDLPGGGGHSGAGVL